jgi:hypothetical protein
MSEASKALSRAENQGSYEPAVSTVTQLDDGTFRFVSTATANLPVGAVWPTVQNLEKLVETVLTGIASNFQWVDGGNPGTVPSRYTFVVNGTSLLEEVYSRSHDDHVIQYRLVTPALGIQSYAATIALTAVEGGRTRIVYSRDMRFDDPAAAGGFAELFELEIANLQAYLAKGAN